MFGNDSYHPLSPHGLAMTGAVLGFIGWLVHLVWHGLMAQPSIVGMLYNVSPLDPKAVVGVFVCLVVGSAVFGWLLATVYNWSIKKK